jgi:hypothetical protein
LYDCKHQRCSTLFPYTLCDSTFVRLVLWLFVGLSNLNGQSRKNVAIAQIRHTFVIMPTLWNPITCVKCNPITLKFRIYCLRTVKVLIPPFFELC